MINLPQFYCGINNRLP